MATGKSYSQIKAERDRNGGVTPIPPQKTKIDRALEKLELDGSASHAEVMQHLAQVLIPALGEVKALLKKAGSPYNLTEGQRQNCSAIWETVSKMMRTRSPRSVDLDIRLVPKLLAETRQIARTELTKKTAHSYFNQNDA